MFVGITGELLRGVRRRIAGMSTKEINSLGEQPVVFVNESDIEAMVWGEYLHLKSQIPEHWMCQIAEVCGKVVCTLHCGDLHEQYFTASLVDGLRMWAPPNLVCSHQRFDLSELPAMKPLIVWATAMAEADKRWTEVEAQVTEFLSKCKSLNEALKLYPDLSVYIPEGALKKVAEKREVSTKEIISAAKEALQSIDTDQLRAAAAIARMST